MVTNSVTVTVKPRHFQFPTLIRKSVLLREVNIEIFQVAYTIAFVEVQVLNEGKAL